MGAPAPRQCALMALLCSMTPLAHAQNALVSAPDIEQRIQHVITGLTGGVVIKGNEHATQTLANRMTGLRVPGVSIAVIHRGKIEWARGFGVRSLGGPPVTADTMFQAASISKPLAAMAALRMVQEGKLSLDADVNTYLTSWKFPADPVAMGKPITLRELLTHTAGTTVHGFPGYATDEPVPTLLQVINGERPANTPAIRSEAAPGVNWKYSGGGYTIMQQVLIETSKEPFPKLMRASVLIPIGMTHSTYEQPLPQALQILPLLLIGPTASLLKVERTPTPKWQQRVCGQPRATWHATQLKSSNPWRGKLIMFCRSKMTRQMLTAGIGHWGLGLEIGGTDPNQYFSHGGANEGFMSIFVAYEKSGDGAAVMTNSDAGGELGHEVMHSIADEYEWNDYRSTIRVAVRIDPKILAQYVGTFELRKGFDLVVTLEGTQLMIQATGEGKDPLYAETETKFFPTVVPAEIEFVKDGQGKVTHLVLHRNGYDIKAPKK